MELTELEAAGLKAALYGPPADRVWLYVHGKGGCKEEAEDFAALACPRGWQVLAADLPEHGTRRGDGVINTGFQVLFHSPPGVLFTFPSQYYALSVTG